MKTFWLYFSILMCITCQKNNEYHLTGTISVGGQTTLHTLLLQGSDTTFSIIPDSTGQFDITQPAGESPFFNLYGVVTEAGGEKQQFTVPLYLSPHKTIDMHLTWKDHQMNVRVEDRENQALQAFQQYDLQQSKELWSTPPPPEKLQDWLSDYLQEEKRIIKTWQPNEEVKEYLKTWSQLSYRYIFHNIPYIYSQQSDSRLADNLMSDLPELPEIVDKPYWKSFYSSSTQILDYLQKNAKTPEEQIKLLKERFQTPSIQEDLLREIIAGYLIDYPYSDDNLHRLERMCTDLPERESILQQYRNKRYSVIGAPLPEVTFEDTAGNKHRLSDFKDKYLYIDLWASWCGPCCAEVPYLQTLEKEVKNKEVVFISISIDEDRQAWKKKMEQLNMHGNQWIVTDNTFAEMLNIIGIPHFLIYDKKGRLLEYKAPRPSTGASLRDKLNQLK